MAQAITPFLNSFRSRARNLIQLWLKTEKIPFDSFGKEELAEAIRSGRFNHTLTGLGKTTFAEICKAVDVHYADIPSPTKPGSKTQNATLTGNYDVTAWLFSRELTFNEKEQLVLDVRRMKDPGVAFVEHEGQHGLVIWNPEGPLTGFIQKAIRRATFSDLIIGGATTHAKANNVPIQPVAWFKDFLPHLKTDCTWASSAQSLAQKPQVKFKTQGELNTLNDVELAIAAEKGRHKTMMAMLNAKKKELQEKS